MKQLLKRIGTVCLLVVASSATVFAAGGTTGGKETVKLIKAAMASRVMIQTVAKARKELTASLKAFDARQKMLANAINNPKMKNLMLFVGMNVDEIKSTIKKPYSLDNAAVVVDLAEAVSEGELKIASVLKKTLKGKIPAFVGQRYDITQIAKYYMAYQAGLKDDVTVQQMKKTVDHFQATLKMMKTHKGNNAKMNQIVNRIDKLWKVVHQFYLDIEEGGLPLIVYQTSQKLNQELQNYSKELFVHKEK